MLPSETFAASAAALGSTPPATSTLSTAEAIAVLVGGLSQAAYFDDGVLDQWGRRLLGAG